VTKVWFNPAVFENENLFREKSTTYCSTIDKHFKEYKFFCLLRVL